MQQFFRRTDLGPGSAAGATGQGEPPRGWHMDQAFLPKHYESTPRQMFYHTVRRRRARGPTHAVFWASHREAAHGAGFFAWGAAGD